MKARHPLMTQLSVDTNRTLAFQETDDMGDAVLRRHTQTHVDMIGH